MTHNLNVQSKLRARGRLGRRSVLGGAVVAIALIAAACGGSSSTSSNTTTTAAGGKVNCASGTISGAGSTFVQTIAQQWIKDYQAKCPGSTVNYQGVGSGAGIQQFNAGTVNFGASDIPFAAAEQTAANAKYPGGAQQIIWSAGPIAIEYHLSSVSNLKLSPLTLAGIFAGAIKTWNDPAIAADNPGTTLPSEGIQAVHRSDGSGTTAAVTGYLTTVAGNVWTFGVSKNFAGPGGQGAKGSDGVTAVVTQTEGAIGYAELSYAKGGQVSTASIKNASGNFVQPSSSGATAALASTTVNPDGTAKINYQANGSASYPLSTFTYVLVPTKSPDPAVGTLLKDFVQYALGPGQSSATKLYYAPLPANVASQSQAAAAGLS